MVGLGAQEILVLLILVGGIAGIVFLFLTFSRRSDGSGRVAELEDENRRLRDENDRLRGRPD